MRFSIKIQNVLLELICLLYVLLFVYASVSKLLDFENFQVQLGQSPMLSAFTGWVSWGVIIVELITSFLLIFPKTRRVGLYIAFTLMVMFTAYIFIILNFSSFVPCSCGGILEKLTWTQHFIFNICFIIIALIGLMLCKTNIIKSKSFILSIISVFIGGIIFVIALYVLSEEEIHRNNSFLRRYPPHSVTTIKGLNIKYNSYYIAGVAGEHIYLGNTSAPVHILSIDTTLNELKTHQIELNNEQKVSFSSPQIKISYPHFFVIDGTVPVIYKGFLNDWKAKFLWRGSIIESFTQVESISSTHFVFSGLDKKSGQNVIGKLDFQNSDTICISKELLKKQIDGVFDTDGMLSYNAQLDRLLYVYYYRNEFLTVDKQLNLDYHGRTIDTVRQASIKISVTNSGQVRKLENQPVVVNSYSNTWGNYLFIKSDRLGRYEPEVMLKDASIVDVYNLKNKTYEFSFYLYHYQGESIKSFTVYKNILIGLSEHYIVLYRLQPHYFNLEND